MPRIRAAWLIILVVVLLTVAVKPLRQQITLPLIVNSLFSPESAGSGSQPPRPSRLDVLRERAAAFAKQRYPDDPEMLLAAGLLTPDTKMALELLKQAAEKGNPSAAWVAYCDALLAQLPEWDRLGESGVDPTRPDLVAQEMKRLQERKLPDRLDPKAVAPTMAALASWQKADPQNGLPLALEMRLRYGMHDERKALVLWEEASAKSNLKDYSQEQARLAAKLLSQLGLPEPEALLVTLGYASTGHFVSLRQGARIAQYEGKLAQMQGLNADAIRWWNSAITVGRKLQETSDTTIGYLVGVAIEGIGASPTWRLYKDKLTGQKGGPFYEGRYWYGRDHAFYVKKVGEERDVEVRDSLVRAKVRSQMLREDTEGMMDRFTTGPYMRGVKLVMFGAGAALFGVLCLLLFLAAGTWRRKQADEAATFFPIWQALIAIATFLPLLGLYAFFYRVSASGGDRSQLDGFSIALLVGPILAALAISIAAQRLGRVPGSRLRKGFRGNLRRTLPDTAALALLCFLVLNLAALKPRAEWIRQWSDPKMTEMAQLRQRLGEKWENPPIPKDAWRAAYPPIKDR